ncbi:DUF6197 family protein [Streptomyces malaysiensis]|uniref:DUF6197 family protein n=1 Tax=Streptomyces malaysiensis TaxID=92644 RepID=UPI00085312D6|nr:hypothetical protein [Streptomyces sp. SPMA113]
MTAAISTHATAAQYAAEHPAFWTGLSGEQVSGEQAARHIDATLALLERDGWVRTYGNDNQDVEMPAEDASVKEMLRGLFRVIRDFMGTDKRRTLLTAIDDVAYSDDGDSDTETVAKQVLNVILRARSGASTAYYGAWASKLGRTWEEVSDLLVEAATFARTYGPTA